jgi:multidrug efflux pump subunit AcrA (membrane-fusion protein)
VAGRIGRRPAGPQYPRGGAGAAGPGRTAHYAYVIKDDDTVERRAVEFAATQDRIAVISKGLPPGERIAVDGQHRLTEAPRAERSFRGDRT